MRRSPVPDHRLRYRHLADRRRLGFELERIWTRITGHGSWAARPRAERAALEAALTVPLAAPNEDVACLESDVRALTGRLVLFARVLRALETGEPLPRPRR